jgi:hypothetical protein
MSLDLNKLENKLDEALSNETSETLNKFLNDKKMKNETNKINLTGGSNSVFLTDESNSTTTTICKFEPIQTYQNGNSSKTLPCAKCGKQAWQHPIINNL